MRSLSLSDPVFLMKVVVPPPFVFVEHFDYPSWSGTIEDPNYYQTFVFDADWVEDFEYPWAGTISDSNYYLTLTFDADWVEDFETSWTI
jgi:hypothetical protein